MGDARLTVLVFDWGLKQIGVAVGNGQSGNCQPLPILKAREGQPDWQMVEQLIAEWRPAILLVGEPLNMDGSPGLLQGRAQKFANRLHGRFGLPCKMVDERLSSFAAKEALRNRGHRGDYRRAPADSLAAVKIFETWVETGGNVN